MAAKNTYKIKEAKPLALDTDSSFTLSTRLPLLAAVFAFVLYANSIWNGYVLDDAAVITNNEFVQQGVGGIGKIFSTDIWHFQNVQLGYYRPLSVASFALEQQFFNNSPHISHFINVLLYACTAFLLCMLLIRVFKNEHPAFSFLVTLLFVAHPIHTEVVANLKSRDEMLSFLNMVLAALFALKAVNDSVQRRNMFLVSFLFFYLALLSKESALTGIFLIPLLIWFNGQYTVKQLLTYATPFLLLFLLFELQKYVALGAGVSMNGTEITNYPYMQSGSRMASMFLIFAWCVKLICLPYPLLYSYSYDQIPAATFSSTGFFIGSALALGMIYFVFKQMQQKTFIAIGMLIFGITLAPALGFVLLRGGIMAERFLYAPCLGFCVVLVGLLASVTKFIFKGAKINLSSFSSNKFFSGSLLIFLVLYAVQTISRNAQWKDEWTLMSHDIKMAKNNSQISFHYGTKLLEKAANALSEQDKTKYLYEGIGSLQFALTVNPHLPDAYYQIGQAYHKILVNQDSAVFYYNRAILENSRYPYSYLGLGTLSQESGKEQLASYYYNKAVEMNPFLKEAVVLHEKHKQETGLDVKEFPTDSVSGDVSEDGKDFMYYNLKGKEFGQRGDFVNAIRYLEKSVALNPNSEEALTNLSVCLGMTKNYDRCIVVLNKVLQLNPTNVSALTNLAVIYRHIGNAEKASELQKKIEELKVR